MWNCGIKIHSPPSLPLLNYYSYLYPFFDAWNKHSSVSPNAQSGNQSTSSSTISWSRISEEEDPRLNFLFCFCCPPFAITSAPPGTAAGVGERDKERGEERDCCSAMEQFNSQFLKMASQEERWGKAIPSVMILHVSSRERVDMKWGIYCPNGNWPEERKSKKKRGREWKWVRWCVHYFNNNNEYVTVYIVVSVVEARKRRGEEEIKACLLVL